MMPNQPNTAKFDLPKNKFKTPPVALPNLIGLFADILSIGTTLGVFYGIGNYVGGASSQIAVSLSETPFTVRFALITVIATALGWAYGSLSVRMTRTAKEHWHVMSHISALIFAATLVAASEMVADGTSDGLLPQVQFFTFLGLAIVFWLCRFQYRAKTQYDGAAALNQRAIGLLVFAANTVFVLVLLELG